MLKKDAESFKTGRASVDYFTGTAWITRLSSNEITVNVARVVFEPGSRTYWHTHPGGQILIVTEGRGTIQKRGEPIQLLLPGDTVTILAGEEHWHGAAADSVFTHIAVQPAIAGIGDVEWLRGVTDEE